MKTCGVIVEYNPFHNGHSYHLLKARETTQADVVIAVMSGNFVQRGEPAIIDKWARSQAALANVADLVVELPFCWSVQSADYFAKGAVGILQQMGCDTLCFGTDTEEAFDYQKFADFTAKHQKEINQAFKEMNPTWNYPQKMTAVYRQLYPEIHLDFDSPNHILGMCYSRENALYSQPMKIVPIARSGAGYHQTALATNQIASATAIRQAILQERSVEQWVPAETANALTAESLMTWEKMWPFLKYKIISSSINELQAIYQMKEGLEYRIKEVALVASCFVDFIEKLKSKRYTWVRLQRLCLYILGNISNEEIAEAQKNQQLRILGFTEAGKNFIKNNKDLPWVSRFGKKESQSLALNLKMDWLYQSFNPEIPEQNFGRQPNFWKN
ncbi:MULTISPECIES: nucleotidyltransferase [unclassified Enterococcus]|uniref:nucleotidyltransferase n=1 Tax=unclassified Enterococcus TaxID=2608891 RepID=UPI00247421F5|nr:MULTISPECIES: nucleotidyltransferase [unclassified Enterococcus]